MRYLETRSEFSRGRSVGRRFLYLAYQAASAKWLASARKLFLHGQKRGETRARNGELSCEAGRNSHERYFPRVVFADVIVRLCRNVEHLADDNRKMPCLLSVASYLRNFNRIFLGLSRESIESFVSSSQCTAKIQEQFKTHVGVYNRSAVSIARHSRRGRGPPSFRVDFCYRKSSAWLHISFFLSPWPASIRPHVCQDKHERWHDIVTSAYLLCMHVNWCQFELKLSGMANALLSLTTICFTYLLRAHATHLILFLDDSSIT